MSSSSSSSSQTKKTLHYADDPSRFPMEGGCSCGQTRYRLLRAPLVVHCCHCTACQRETGSAFAVNLMIEERHVIVIVPGPAATADDVRGGPTLPASPAAPDVFPRARPLVFYPSGSGSSGSGSSGSEYDDCDDDDDDDDKKEKQRQECDTGRGIRTMRKRLRRVLLPQESGDPQTVSRCPTCLTAVWQEYGGLGPSVLFVRGGTLDRAWLVRPDVHIFVRSKRDFVGFSADDGPDGEGDKTPRFEGYYDRRHVWRAESLARWDEVVMPGILKGREEEERRRVRGKEQGTTAAAAATT